MTSKDIVDRTDNVEPTAEDKLKTVDDVCLRSEHVAKTGGNIQKASADGEVPCADIAEKADNVELSDEEDSRAPAR